jgi:class 3 adenylate cyclase
MAPEEPIDVKLSIRIGINTGQVLLGQVGTTSEFTAMGDTVNTASRLEHAAPVGGILISHHTFQHISGIFDVKELEPLYVKGKSEALQVYLVQRLKPRRFRSSRRGIQGVYADGCERLRCSACKMR